MSSRRRLSARRGVGTHRWIVTVPLITLCNALSGCAVGSFGTLAAKVERRDTLSMLSVYSAGLHLRTRADDRGANFGYSRRVYAFAADDTLQPGWYFLRVPSPARSAFAQDLKTVGIDLSLSAPEAGLALGYAHTRLMARVALDDCVIIDYVGSALRIARFQTCAKDTACAKP